MKTLIYLSVLVFSLQGFADQMPGAGGMNGGSSNNGGMHGGNSGNNGNNGMGSNSGNSGGVSMGSDNGSGRIGVSGDLRLQACARLYANYDSQSRCTQYFQFSLVNSDQYLTTLSMWATFQGRVVTCSVAVLSNPNANIRVALPPTSCY